ASRRVCSRGSFVATLRGHWTGLDSAWTSDVFWNWSGLPGPATQFFQDGMQIRCNPLWYLCRGASEGDAAAYPFFESLQHGDLHCRNILVDNSQLLPQPSTAFRFIDFEKTATVSSVLDLCWLALSLLPSTLRTPGPDATDWDLAAPRFVS